QVQPRDDRPGRRLGHHAGRRPRGRDGDRDGQQADRGHQPVLVHRHGPAEQRPAADVSNKNGSIVTTSERMRIYYIRNRERILARSNRYYEENKTRARSYYRKNRAKLIGDSRRRSILHREEAADSHRRWKANNPEAAKESNRRWRSNNPGKVSIYRIRRRTSERSSAPIWVDCRAIDRIYKESALRSTETGIPHHVDHIYPLRHSKFSGLHVPWNLRIV